MKDLCKKSNKKEKKELELEEKKPNNNLPPLNNNQMLMIMLILPPKIHPEDINTPMMEEKIKKSHLMLTLLIEDQELVEEKKYLKMEPEKEAGELIKMNKTKKI